MTNTPGPKPIYKSAMRVVSFLLPDYLIEFLNKKESRSAFVRQIIDAEYKKEELNNEKRKTE